jgi:hypothetical protein
MHNFLRKMIAAVLFVVTISGISNTVMAQYKPMPRVRTLADAVAHNGEIVKVFGVLEHKPLKNGKVTVKEDAFFIRLADGQFVFVPYAVESYASMVGKKVFIVAPLRAPGTLSLYPDLRMTWLDIGSPLMAVDNKTLVKPQLSSIKELDKTGKQFQEEPSFFAYISGHIDAAPAETATFPLKLKIKLNDGNSVDAVVDKKDDLEELYGKKVVVSGQVSRKDGRFSIAGAHVSDYDSYMDWHSAK